MGDPTSVQTLPGRRGLRPRIILLDSLTWCEPQWYVYVYVCMASVSRARSAAVGQVRARKGLGCAGERACHDVYLNMMSYKQVTEV